MKNYYLIIILCLSALISNAQLKIYEVYPAGGNAGPPAALYNADYVMISNPTSAPVSLSGWSLQYAATSGNFTASANLSGTVPAYSFFLVQVSTAGTNGSALPSPDLNISGSITNFAQSNGKVALMSTTTALTGTTPVGQAGYEDFVGYGTANAFEGSSAAPATSTALAIRRNSLINDTNVNSTDFSTVTPAPKNSSSPFPVRLISFKSESLQTGIELTWQTASEANNSHFDIERSIDAKSFETIGRVMGEGNKSKLSSYSFLDISASLGVNYYRLKQVDFNGTYEYSRIIAGSFNGQNSFRAFPNPVISELHIQIPNDTEIVSATLYDVSGRAIKSNISNLTFNLESIKAGMYILKVNTSNGQNFQQKIVKID